MLIVFSGLPGSGKSTIATALARQISAVHIRIDTIEQALRDAGQAVDVAGYLAGYGVARDNLRVGHTVIADCVNPIAETRNSWRAIGDGIGVQVFDVEVVCGDELEHRRRIETRTGDIPNLKQPTWADVQDRQYQPWDHGVITVDTAGRAVDDCVRELAGRLPQ